MVAVVCGASAVVAVIVADYTIIVFLIVGVSLPESARSCSILLVGADAHGTSVTEVMDLVHMSVERGVAFVCPDAFGNL